MSGYAEQTYIFEGGFLPQEFVEGIYGTGSRDAQHLRFLDARISNWGDDLTVRVCADSQETIDWHLQKWETNKKPKEVDL